jgi:Flp pilus assembly protein TadG
MRRLDQRGTAAFEFCLVGALFFTLLFAVFDIGRYVLTAQSLQMLADAGARAAMLCSTKLSDFMTMKGGTWPTDCTGTSLMSSTDMQNTAPFLYAGGYTVTLNVGAPATGVKTVTVTASTTFKMLIPLFGGRLDSPSATTTVPFS